MRRGRESHGKVEGGLVQTAGRRRLLLFESFIFFGDHAVVSQLGDGRGRARVAPLTINGGRDRETGRQT